MGNIHADDDFLKEVAGKLQRIQLGGFLLFRFQSGRQTGHKTSVPVVDGKVHLFLDIATVPLIHQNAYIHTAAPEDQVVIDDIFHDVYGIVLAVVEADVPQADIRVVIFVGIVEVGLSLDIVPLGHPVQEGVYGMGDIGRNRAELPFSCRILPMALAKLLGLVRELI